MITVRLIISTTTLLACAGFAQVSSAPPVGALGGTPIHLVGVTRVEVSHNSPAVIRQELLDTNTISLLAAATSLTPKELATIAVAPGPAEGEVWLYHIGRAGKAWNVFGAKLQFYIHGRLEGHTKAFVLSSLTNVTRGVQTAVPDLRVLLSRRPELPAHLLKRSDSDSHANQIGEIFRTVRYYYVDGEIAWCYDLNFSEDGKLLGDSELRVDAKEYDPKYQQIIREVDQAVRAEMQREGGGRRFGALHTFSQKKKDILSARGVSYRTFEELNPGVIPD